MRMATWNSEDEFDQMPDDIDFAAIGEDQWNAIQIQNSSTSVQSNVHATDISANSQPPISYEGHRIAETQSADITVPQFVQGSSNLYPEPVTETRRAITPSSVYSSDEADELDDAFFQQLDELENQIINGSSATAPAATIMHNVYDTEIDSPPMKRRRLEDCNENSETPLKQSIKKFEGDWAELLDEYDDELNCPVCCDILVAAHLVNGCGHTLCGSCGYQWIVEKYRNTCPVCRAKCHALTPLIPNITADNFVHKHLRVRARLGDKDWEVGGSKLLEWQGRKDKWKNDCEQRTRRSKKMPSNVIRPRVDNLGQLAYTNRFLF
ncbi:ring finger protein 8 [Lentinula edodes]|uniref:Ring finger protein 8 n=1 Tax=Lentinula edodes TaxID=5353 RepID=A0A1Q3EC69_LENED|nr:ring finger protein 8 [Lentinula edodes]